MTDRRSSPVTIRLTLPAGIVERLRRAADAHKHDGLHGELALAIEKHLRDVAESEHLEQLRAANARLPRRDRLSEHTLIALAARHASRARKVA